LHERLGLAHERPWRAETGRVRGVHSLSQLKPLHFDWDPTAPRLCAHRRIVVDLWQVQSLQGNNRAATQGSNQGKLMSQIPMALQLVPAV